MAGISEIMKAVDVLSPVAAAKLLEKFNPKFKSYFSKAVTYGFGIDSALEYLKNRFQSETVPAFRQQLEGRAPSGQLRPDEQIALNQLRQAEMPTKALRAGASIGAGALLGGLPGAAVAAAGQVAPEESEKIASTQPKTAEEARKMYNARQKKRRLSDQLEEDYEREYGETNLQSFRPGQRAGQSDADQELLAAIDKILKM